MTFKAFEREKKVLGFYHLEKKDLIFFGTKHLEKKDLKVYFPFLDFSELNQVHKAEVVEISHSQSPLPTADGQWTTKLNLALTIKTADCIPLLVSSQNAVGAVHAGWRGVVAKISGQLQDVNAFNGEDVKNYLGPHIRKENFEVGLDVANEILNADPLKDRSNLLPHPNAQKKFVDLTQVLKNQLKGEVFDGGWDTFSNPDLFWSYRRDTVQNFDRSKSTNPRRLYSFIARIDPSDFPKLNL